MAFALACIVGCGGGGGGSAGAGGDPMLVGDWKMTSMSVNGGPFFAPSTIEWDVRLQINGDGSLSATEVWQGSSESSGGGWSVNGGQLHVAAGWLNWTGPYSTTANSFTLSSVANYDGEGHSGSFVFSRQSARIE